GRCPGAVGVVRLPGVAELGDRAFFAGRDEDRVVAEPLVPARLLGDATLESACPPELAAVGGEGNELAAVARRPLLHPVERLEERRHGVRGPARGLDSR